MANDPDKLARAAEELIKAASSHVDFETLAINRDAVEALKKLASETASVKNSLTSLKESQDAKMNTMIQSIGNVEGKLDVLTQRIEAQTKNQALAWAYDNASVNAFIYYDKPKDSYSHGNQVQSTELVRTILLSFRRNCGHHVADRSLIRYYNESEEAKASGEKKFREASNFV